MHICIRARVYTGGHSRLTLKFQSSSLSLLIRQKFEVAHGSRKIRNTKAICNSNVSWMTLLVCLYLYIFMQGTGQPSNKTLAAQSMAKGKHKMYLNLQKL